MADRKQSAEEIFNKSSEELSDIERMMAEIMKEETKAEDSVPRSAAGIPASERAEPFEIPSSPAPPSRTHRQNPENKEEEFFFDTGYAGSPDAADVSRIRAANDQREKKIKKAKKKRGFGAVAVILVICAVLVIGAILVRALREDLPNSFPTAQSASSIDNSTTAGLPPEAESTLSPDVVIPTPEADDSNIKIVEPGSLVLYSDTQTPDPAESAEGAVAAPENVATPVEHSYSIHREDVSWTQAQQKCYELGGHLANISSQEELNEITSLAEAQGLEKLWIGCHRENAALVWENQEDISFYKWGKGEPSGYDSGDRVTEDYIMLWKFNGDWVYNDSRNDPVKDYPAMYSGQIGYVCEYGDTQ